MNTGISKGLSRFALALLAGASLAGCSGDGGGGLSFAAPNGEPEGAQIGPAIPKAKSTQLAQGDVTVKAPDGYCVDETSVVSNLAGSSVILGKCSALDGKGASAETSAIMTVSVSPRRDATSSAPTPEDLAQSVAPASVLSSQQTGALSLVHVANGGDDIFAPADPKHWRGATMLDTRLVLLGLYAPKGAPMAENAGAALMTQLARGISATRGGLLGLGGRNRTARDSPQKTDIGADSADAIANEGTGSKQAPENLPKRLFGRLFNRS